MAIASGASQLAGTDSRRHVARIRQFADPHRQVDTLAHKIDEAIRLPHLDLDFAMGLEERRHDRHDMEAPEYDRRRHDEFASGREIHL